MCCLIRSRIIFWLLTLGPWESLFWPQGLSTVSGLSTLSVFGTDVGLNASCHRYSVLGNLYEASLAISLHPPLLRFSGEKYSQSSFWFVLIVNNYLLNNKSISTYFFHFLFVLRKIITKKRRLKQIVVIPVQKLPFYHLKYRT